MRHKTFIIIIGCFFFLKNSNAQDQFSLADCIQYAWENSTAVERSNNNEKVEDINLKLSKSSRYPSLNFSTTENIYSNSNYQNSPQGGTWVRSEGNSLNWDLNSDITLYNGGKINKSIGQSEINLDQAINLTKNQKEAISLNILNAYTTVLQAKENVANDSAQLAGSENQLEFAEARKSVGAISTVDYLNIKSQYVSTKSQLTASKNDLKMAYVNLMQYMNMPLSEDFEVVVPNIDQSLLTTSIYDVNEIYQLSLGIRPSIAAAELDYKSAQSGINIAKADALPKLSLTSNLGSGYSSSLGGLDMGNQVGNSIGGSIGISLSIPIYQRNQIKSKVQTARIQADNSMLSLMDAKNDLRKAIEQTCTDVVTAASNYEAIQEEYQSEKEAYHVSDEMFRQGMINATDLIISKNKLIAIENKLTQAKYNLIVQKKLINYYKGESILF